MKNKQVFNAFFNKANLNKARSLNNMAIDLLDHERIYNNNRLTKEEADLYVYVIELLRQLNSKI